MQAGAIEKALLHLDSSSEAVVREVFAFLAVVLYEGNRKVQVSVELPWILEYLMGNSSDFKLPRGDLSKLIYNLPPIKALIVNLTPWKTCG